MAKPIVNYNDDDSDDNDDHDEEEEEEEEEDDSEGDDDTAGADPGFFLGGGALVSCSTSTPINHIVFFVQNTSCIRKPQVISKGRGAHPRHPPPRSAPVLILIMITFTVLCPGNFECLKK